MESFVDDFGIQLWKDCCQAAEKCCQMMLESHNEGKKLIDYLYEEIQHIIDQILFTIPELILELKLYLYF